MFLAVSATSDGHGEEVLNMRARLLAAALVLVSSAACVAPGIALVDISAAQAELAAAKTAEAEKWAPYEYTAGDLYLKQAKDRLGYSGTYYQEAYEYAEKSFKFAHQAKEKALNHPKE
jgi:hypothetical protein